MSKEQKRNKLIDSLKNLPNYMQERLKFLKSEKIGADRPDFIWHYLLQSFSTMGNSRGHAGLILNKSNYNQVTYDVIKQLNESKRIEHFDLILRKAGVRMPSQKAKWLNDNYKIIERMGGLENCNKLIFSQKGSEQKMQFLMKFSGIGEKYSRNIFMDIYEPDFHNRIAIDDRIKQITNELGYTFNDYVEHEKFYLSIAQESNLNGWELDRLLYNYKDYFLDKIRR